MNNKPDIGKIIMRQLEKSNQSVVWLAKQIGHDHSNLCKQLKCRSLDPDLLSDISEAMNVDFHAYYSQRFYKNKYEKKYGKCYHIGKKNIKQVEIITGEQIRRQIMIQGFTVSEFAKRTGCARSSVYRILKGKGINKELLRKISDVLEHDFFQYYRIDDGEET